MKTPQRHLSTGKRARSFLLVSGSPADTEKDLFAAGDICEQTQSNSKDGESVLESPRTHPGDVTKKNIWLTSKRDASNVNAFFRVLFSDSGQCQTRSAAHCRDAIGFKAGDAGTSSSVLNAEYVKQ